MEEKKTGSKRKNEVVDKQGHKVVQDFWVRAVRKADEDSDFAQGLKDHPKKTLKKLVRDEFFKHKACLIPCVEAYAGPSSSMVRTDEIPLFAERGRSWDDGGCKEGAVESPSDNNKYPGFISKEEAVVIYLYPPTCC